MAHSTSTPDKAQYDMLQRCAAKGDPTEWNEWRKRNRDTPIQLQGTNLSGANLKGVNLKDANLQQAILDDANLKEAVLVSANLSKASLNKTSLQNAELFCADLLDASLIEADLKNAHLDGLHFENINMLHAIFDGASLSNIKILGKETVLNYTSFKKAILSGASFAQDLEFCNTDFRGARLDNAHLENTTLCGIHFEKASMMGIHLEGATLKHAHLEDATLTDAHLEGATCTSANLQDAFMAGTDLKKANLNYAYLNNVAFAYGDYRDTKKDKKKCNIEGASFHYARVDAGTIILESACTFDCDTDFTGVALSTARISPGLITAFQTNIRRKKWQEYYENHGLRTLPIRAFWTVSDYGNSMLRVFQWMLGLAFFYAIIYCVIAYNTPYFFNAAITGTNCLLDFFSAFCLALTTMVTFGLNGEGIFTDASHTWWSAAALSLSTVNILTGYFFLAELAARIGILFQSLAPEAKSTRKEP